MLYTTLLAATAAFSGLVAAQNGTSATGPLPNGISPCCNVNAGTVPEGLRDSWCEASTNTCPEVCGGQAQIASGGNTCDEVCTSSTLVYMAANLPV